MKSKKEVLVFAMDLMFANRIIDNTTIHISEANNGRSCECICPVCGKRVIARQGKKNKWSFAHESFSDCSGETALHLYAKNLIEREKRFYVPGISIIDRPLSNFSESFIANVKKAGCFPSDFVINSWEGKEFIPEKVVLEERLANEGVIPDVVVYINSKPVIVEIYVTHPVDLNKKRKLRQAKLSAIEVDLSEVNFDEMSKQELDEIILGKTDKKYWIYNARTEQDIEYEQLLKIFEEKNRFLAFACHTTLFTDKKRISPSNYSIPVDHDKREWIYNNSPKCPFCGAIMKIRHNKKDGSFFWSCPNYFKTGCKGVKSSKKWSPSCPQCEKGTIVPIYSSKIGRHFFHCSDYPKCNYSIGLSEPYLV